MLGTLCRVSLRHERRLVDVLDVCPHVLRHGGAVNQVAPGLGGDVVDADGARTGAVGGADDDFAVLLRVGVGGAGAAMLAAVVAATTDVTHDFSSLERCF